MTDDKKYLARGCDFIDQTETKPKQVIYKQSRCKLSVFDWLENLNLSSIQSKFDYVEIRFKNSRKDFYKIADDLDLKTGDIVAVESNPGHDIGIVTLTGEIVKLQMQKKASDYNTKEIKKVYRKAKAFDIDKWCAAVELEEPTLHKAREIIQRLGLQMKLSDVEYQGDKTKAIFYYTAEDRVDFRELIKIMAEEFQIRIEMKQIGVRQEASRLGGIGSCGRELCCSSWLTNFTSVSTNAARMQQLSLNPNKLAGQCGKLKCCLNYEYNFYEEVLKAFPDMDTVLKTKKGIAIHQKTDVFKKLIWYSYQYDPSNMFAVTLEDAWEVIKQNKKGQIPEEVKPYKEPEKKTLDYHSNTNDDSYAI